MGGGVKALLVGPQVEELFLRLPEPTSKLGISGYPGLSFYCTMQYPAIRSFSRLQYLPALNIQLIFHWA